VYAFGVILWELLSELDPFSQFSEEGRMGMPMLQRYSQQEIADPKLQDLYADCLAPDPSARPTFDEICCRLALLLE